jgi:hypothetical protein
MLEMASTRRSLKTVLENDPEIRDAEILLAIQNASAGAMKLLFGDIPVERSTLVYDGLAQTMTNGFDPHTPKGWISVVAREAVQDIEAKLDFSIDQGDDIDARWDINESAMHANLQGEREILISTSLKSRDCFWRKALRSKPTSNSTLRYRG